MALKSNKFARIKSHAAGVLVTPATALFPVLLCLPRAEEKGAGLVKKPRASLYAMHDGHGVAYPYRHVANLTVTSAVAR